MKCLENGYFVAQFCKISCTGQTGRTGTDHSYLDTIGGLWLSRYNAVLSGPVCYETLQFTDGNRIALKAADTFSFTLALLWTNTSADCWQCTGLSDSCCCVFELAFFYF